MLIHLGGAAVAQDASGADQSFRYDLQQENRRSEPELRQPGQRNVVPLTGRFVLNGITLDYGATGFLSAGVLDGAHRRSSLDFTGTYALRSDLSEGIEGRLFQRRQVGWYLQLQSADQHRTITTTREEAVDLLGSRVRLSVTGGCIAPEAAPGALCTYTPGLEVDPHRVDPNTLVPGGFILSSQFGQEISLETHEALKAPGFQRGVAGGDVVGMDLDFSNTGFTLSQDRSGANRISRYEDVEQRSVLTLSRVEQNLTSSSTQASLGRTIRSFTLLDEDEWTQTAFILQAAAWLLPALDGQLPAGDGDPNLRISNNLFLSANNLRLPRDSITAYQSGVSRVTHSASPARRASETPVAWTNGVWLGFSQVRDVSVTNRVSYVPTGPRRDVASQFTQGGLDVAWDGLSDGTITVVDAIDQQITELDFSDIDNLFVQTGVDVTTQEATRRVISQEVSTYRYVPHLSFSGNRTSGTSVLRYYTGVILSDETTAYVGADYALNTEQGWSAYLRADVYSNPDQDHYSEVEGRLSRRFKLSEDRNFTLGVAAHAELDRPNLDGSVPRLGEGSSGIDLVGGYQSGPLSLTARERFSDVNTDTGATSTTFGLTYRVNPA
ncbi:hypothetical protein [Rubellimicrobium mesophilum]|uniref:hypothetical protein n=1 Tax=Rubellimicrobium mesophilum TaxID=1123067 RepID=UPI000AB1B48A|nr:hypothetical protein [Rubellimicrobium mesophilum]